MNIKFLICVLALTGCAAPQLGAPPDAQTIAQPLPPQIAAENFVAVLDDVAPVAKEFCRRTNAAQSCDFVINVDDDPYAPPNAYQWQAPNGAPVITFTLSLIADAQTRDELAFVMGHEAAHHILGHIAQTQRSAAAGAILAGLWAGLAGQDQAGIDRAVQVGGDMGARAYSKDFEYQADLIGTRIAFAAGYDPVLGAAFFDRLPDPGDRFMGSHPGNADRKAQVAAETDRLRRAANQ